MPKKLFYFYAILFIFSSIHITHGQNESLVSKVERWYEAEQYDLIVQDSAAILSYVNLNEDSVSAELLFFLGDAYLAADDLDHAIFLMEKELSIRVKLPDSDPFLIADSKSNLGYYNSVLNNFSEAEGYFLQAVEQYKNIEGPSGESYINTSIMLNQLYVTKGDFQASQKLLKNLEKVTEDVIMLTYIKREKIYLLIQLGQYTEAENLTIVLAEQTKTNFGEASIRYVEALNLLASIKLNQSNYAESEQLFNLAISIAEKLSIDFNTIQSLRNNLAIIYSKIGLFEESNDILKTIVTKEDTYDNALTLRNIGINYAWLNQHDSAKNAFLESIEIVERIFSTNSLPYAVSLKEYADRVSLKVDIDTSIVILKKSLKVAEKILKKSNPEYSKYEFQLGKAFFRNNNLKEAKVHIENAYSLRTKYLSSNHPLYAESTKKLAELAWANNDEKASLSYYNDTFRNYFHQIEAYFPALSEQQKANFYGNTLRPAFEEFNSYVIAYEKNNPELLSDMYNYQLATKGLIMYASAKVRNNILNSNKPELIKQYNSWIETKELVAKAYSLTEEEIKAQNIQLDSLLTASKELEKSLSRESSEFSDVFKQKSITWKDIQAQLKPKEAAIEIIRFKEFSPDSSGMFLNTIYYAALLIHKDSKYPELILMNNGDDLENKFIKNYKNAIKYKVADKYSYKNYWEPIASKTAKYDKIYFSPDGIYNQISINSLYNTKTKKYVLEEQNIQLLTNTKDLIAYRAKSTSNVALNNAPQLFGFPNYNKGLQEKDNSKQLDASAIANNVSMDRGLRGSLSRYIRGNSLVTLLPGTKEEVEKITTLYAENGQRQPTLHLSNAADEQQLKAVDNPSVLHIATHGFFLEDSPVNQDDDSDKYSQNPLLKSGLIMAGANSFITSGIDESTGQDGILTAYEAMNMNLTNTDLVVLSACETGLGDLKNGEGVYGLRRAFFIAGADAIIMSLWSVDDAATQELMSTFYQEWLTGKSKEQAFIDAQLATKKKYEDPFYWAAFVMVGE
ncbi:MAG: CHAT domain-containing protein [Marivirga sp.]|jgi:CHAT domain-containing protein